MRLWPYQMIDVFPRKQLLSQLRENTLISVTIDRTGRTNHMLINKVMDYDIEEFRIYCQLVVDEMYRRSYRVHETTLAKLNIDNFDTNSDYKDRAIFRNWHNERYLRQCIYNLQEKYDCNGLTEDEWSKILDKFSHMDI